MVKLETCHISKYSFPEKPTESTPSAGTGVTPSENGTKEEKPEITSNGTEVKKEIEKPAEITAGETAEKSD